jgi:charged multivesicular body protein 1
LLAQAVQQGHTDIAKIYAQNAIRKQNEKLNLLRLASRIDAVSSRVQTAVTMRQVTGSMTNVVRGMDSAMKAMDLEKVWTTTTLQLTYYMHSLVPPLILNRATTARPCHFLGSISIGDEMATSDTPANTPLQISTVMDKFETQFEDLDVATGYYENATSSATATATPQDDVDRLMNQVADEAGVELQQDMKAAEVPASKVGPTEVEEDGLGERLRALRN